MTIVTLGVIFGAAGGHAPTQHYGFTLAAFMAQFSAAAAYNITYAPYVCGLLALPAAQHDQPRRSSRPSSSAPPAARSG